MAKTTKRIYRKYDQLDEVDQYLVYWIYNRSCTSPNHDGYIGCTNTAKRQIPRALKRFKAKQFKILFRGTRDECLAVENKLRPRPYIGWNTAAGGSAYGHGLADTTKPIDTREKMSEAAATYHAKHERKPKSAAKERTRLRKNALRAARRAAGLPRLY